MATEKTWQFALMMDFPVTGAKDATAYYMWFLKTALTGGVPMKDQSGSDVADPQGKWTVLGSSDGVSAAMDGVDRWGATFDTTKIIHNSSSGGARSWLCLKSPDALGPYYMILDYCGGLGVHSINAVFGKTAPTGGTLVTARPTFADEWTASYTGNGTGTCQVVQNAAQSRRAHLMLCTDGTFHYFTNVVAVARMESALLFVEVKDTHPTDVYKCLSYFEFDASSCTCRHTQGLAKYSAPCWYGRCHNGNTVSGGCSYAGIVPADFNSTTGQNILDGAVGNGMNSADAADGSWPDFPLYVHSTNSSYRTVKGRVPDIRLCSNAIAQGTTEPLTGSPQAIVLGNAWWPTYSGIAF